MLNWYLCLWPLLVVVVLLFFLWKLTSIPGNVVILDFGIIVLFGHTSMLAQLSSSVIIWKLSILAHLFLLYTVNFLTCRAAEIPPSLLFLVLCYRTLIRQWWSVPLVFLWAFQWPTSFMASKLMMLNKHLLMELMKEIA